MTTANAIILFGSLLVIVCLALAAIATYHTPRDIRARQVSRHQGSHRRITPAGRPYWPSSEERAVRRLEKDPIPSRFDRW